RMRRDAGRGALGRLKSRLLPFAALLIVSVALALATDRFLTLANLLDVARRVSVINIIALGMTFVIITGGIDLSVGSASALAVVVLVPLALFAHGVLVRTPFGRYCYALGGNPQAGFLAGLSIRRLLASVYVISGAAAGLAGMIDAARILTGNPTAGQEYELQVIAAVVIGGASLTGGKGTILGATLGAALMAVLQNGSNLLGISPFVQRMVIGSLIVVAVGIDVWRERRSRTTLRN